MNSCIVYLVRNVINGHVYFGQTWSTLEHRFSQHKSDARCGKDHCVKLNRALRKHGSENFRIEPVAICFNQSAADHIEAHLIASYDTIVNGYNIKTGGSHGLWPAEVKARIARSLTGQKHTSERNHRASLVRKGQHSSPSTEFQKGHGLSRGRVYSEGTRRKMSNAKASLTPEQVIAIRADSRTQNLIAADFGIRMNTVSRIKSGVRYGTVR